MAFLNNKQIGIRLIEQRTKTKLSARRYAMDAGVDPSQYSKIEKGELQITENILNKLVVTYGLDKNSILYGGNVPRETPVDQKLEDSGDNSSYITKMPVGEQNILNAIMSMADSSREHGAADRLRAEAELLREQNNKKMIDTITMIGNSDSEIPANVDAKFSRLLGVIAELGTGSGRWKSIQEARAELNRLFRDKKEDDPKYRTRDGSGKQHR